MIFTFNIKPTSEISKPYNPSTIEISVNGVDTNGYVQIHTKTTEILIGEADGNGSGTRVEDRTYFYPQSKIEEVFTRVDLSTGLPNVNITEINKLLSQYNLEVVES